MDPLQMREVFHLVFLRALGRSVPPSTYVLRGGSNLRFFFGSPRYSEDMDLDASGVPVHVLRGKVMAVLTSAVLADTLRTVGVERVVPPRLATAKQTETVQRIKVHLHTAAGEDLPTKVEFSRRGFDAPIRSEAVSTPILAAYRMPPLIVPHYGAEAAARQKVRALLGRRQTEARDIFDLYILSSQPSMAEVTSGFAAAELALAHDRIFSVGYEQYRDTVVRLLGPEDQANYESGQVWDEIRLRAVQLLEPGAKR